MNSTAPTIGFDRYIDLDWVKCTLLVRRGDRKQVELDAALQHAGLGKEAKSKTQTKLNALCLRPRIELDDFILRGITVLEASGHDDGLAAFAWGAAIATYPFFGKVAELLGRLTSIQGDCSTAEIHRRMGEIYGDREITKRATQAVIQTQSNWGAVERVSGGKRVARLPGQCVDSEALSGWLIEAALRYACKPLPTTSLHSLPVLFPFTFTRSISYVVSGSSHLSIRAEGPSLQMVALSRNWTGG